MQKDNSNISLQPSSTDYVASAAKAALGMVPFAGSLLAELAGTIIPNQRIDRIVKFAEKLNEKLSEIEEDFVRSQLTNENFTDLLEEGLRQAARSVTNERRDYIASLIARSLTDKDVEYIESKHLLRILGEINDIEVIWLRFYLVPTFGGDKIFRETHTKILEPVIATLVAPQGTLDKSALQESYKEHLTQLGLLEHKYQTDIQTRTPEFDSFTGGLKTAGYEISPLGRLLLRHIGLGENTA
jgi:hypothetical protein